MRVIISMFAGGVIAGLLFLLMHGMIDQNEDVAAPPDTEPVPEFRHQAREERVEPKPREMPEPPEEREPPPTEPVDTTPRETPPPEFETPEFNAPDGLEGPSIPDGPAGPSGRADGPAEIITQVRPEWPRRALTEGIEGWVRVSFTIRSDGTVTNARVVESHPGQLFDQAAVRAVERWRFRPRVVDGRPVERQATQVLDFDLDNTTR